jgi:hypothetical protein
MARGGFKIFDSDTHVGPDARILTRYLSEAEKERLRGWEALKARDRSGHETYTKGQRRYRRRLGTAEPDEAPAGYMAGFTGVKRIREPIAVGGRRSRRAHQGHGSRGRRRKPDPSLGWFGTWTAGHDVALEMAM